MEYLGEEEYSEYLVERNPRAYMTMRDYRNLSWQSHQPVERNPNPPRSMSDYRDQWMSSPNGNSYHHSWENHINSSWEPRPPQYAPPEPPCYALTSQQQQPPPLSPVEQAILNLSKQVDNFIEDNRVVNVQANREIDTVESSLNKRTDGLQSEMELKLDNLQCSILNLAQQLDHAEEESQEDECLTETILGEQVQPQEELKVESLEAPKELQDAPVTFWPWKKEEHINALITEEGSGIEGGKEPQKLTLQPIPLKLNPTATAQATKCPLPVAPSTDQVYILPSPAPQSQPKTPTANAQATYNPLPVYILHAANSKPTAPAPNHKSNPSLHAIQNFKILVAIAQIFATTSKAQAAAYTAWYSGWFGCRFGFGVSEPRHF